ANKNRLGKRVAGPDALIYRLNGSLRLMTLLKQSWLDGQDADTLLQGKKGEGLRGLLRFTSYYSRGPISEKAMPIASPIPLPIPMLSMNRPITTPVATPNANPRPRLDFSSGIYRSSARSHQGSNALRRAERCILTYCMLTVHLEPTEEIPHPRGIEGRCCMPTVKRT